ncbi:unnamed protein product [Porites evermanni]|uniref:Uncharacterized protein n=1 Tax=Porites evermanni TaxID=104178 RepID=A0ABN8Q555_9CNID|nr:unnamed protein product [Porites evermanni]
MGDLNEHVTLLIQAAEHSKAAQDYDAQAQSTEDYVVHLLTVASNVLVFDKGNENPLTTSLLNSVKELKEKAENELSQSLAIQSIISLPKGSGIVNTATEKFLQKIDVKRQA